MKLHRKNNNTAPATPTPNTVDAHTLTEQFATEYAKSAVPNMLKAIANVKRYNHITLVGALATSYLHQAHYLWSIGAGYFAYLPPVIFDTAMVAMLIVVRTTGIAKDAKWAAMAVFTGAALLSATVNFAAPGALGLRVIFALVVVLVIGVELVAGRIRPDFTAIEKQASELLAAAHKIRAASASDQTDPGNTPAVSNEPKDFPRTSASSTPVAENPSVPSAPITHPASPEAVSPVPVRDVPAHLISTARFVIGQHEQSTGRPITADELALRMSITPAVAGQLLTTIPGNTPAPARHNGHTPALNGADR